MSDTLRNLVDALNKTNWSSWQTTAGFSAQLEAAECEIAAQKVREAAPELLFALQCCIGSLSAVSPGGDQDPDVLRAKAAVAKALGERA